MSQFKYDISFFSLATINILASDDGHGVISFNTSKHFLLREPTFSLGLSESVAMLYVVRNPDKGTFGTVAVQFTITDANGSLVVGDLTPAEGLVVLEDGVRFKVREMRFFTIYLLYIIIPQIYERECKFTDECKFFCCHLCRL